MDLFGCYKTHTLWQRKKKTMLQNVTQYLPIKDFLTG